MGKLKPDRLAVDRFSRNSYLFPAYNNIKLSWETIFQYYHQRIVPYKYRHSSTFLGKVTLAHCLLAGYFASLRGKRSCIVCGPRWALSRPVASNACRQSILQKLKIACKLNSTAERRNFVQGMLETRLAARLACSRNRSAIDVISARCFRSDILWKSRSAYSTITWVLWTQ